MKKIVIQEKGYIKDTIPFNVYTELLNNLKLKDLKSKTKANSNLAGNLESEFVVTHLIPESFFEYLADLVNNYYDNFSLDCKSPNKNFQFLDVWLNYQKKYEFNPLHQHSGSLSWVVWLKIPYDLKNELEHPNCYKSNQPRNSLFSDNRICSRKILLLTFL